MRLFKIIISVFLLSDCLIYEIIYWSKCPAGDAFFPLLFKSEICWVLWFSDLSSTTHVPSLRSVASCYCLLIKGGNLLFGTEWITVYFGPRQSLQWTPFLKTIRWSWYSNRFGFGQFSLLRQNIQNVNIGDQSNVPTSVDSKDLNTLGQDDIIDNIMTLK